MLSRKAANAGFNSKEVIDQCLKILKSVDDCVAKSFGHRYFTCIYFMYCEQLSIEDLFELIVCLFMCLLIFLFKLRMML